MALFTTIIGYWLQTVIRCLSGGLRNLRSAEKDIFSTQCLLSRMYLLAVRTIPSTLSLNKKKKVHFISTCATKYAERGPNTAKWAVSLC